MQPTIGRMSIGKSLRFEIFARDGFTCQYCGTRPPDVVLELDHIHPVSKGGDDEPINLITSCYDCNRGKRAKILSEIAPRPDAGLASLKAYQEIAEAEQYLRTKQVKDDVFARVKEALIDVWVSSLTDQYEPTNKQWVVWLARFSPEEIETSIRLAAPRYNSGKFGQHQGAAIGQLIPYVSGILYSRRRQMPGSSEVQ